MAGIAEVRPSPIAGTWYSGNPDILHHQVSGFIAQAKPPKLNGEVVAVISPHAGYRYSGKTAGYAFSVVQGCQPDLVAVVSPLHNFHPKSHITTAHKAYSTPLGPVWVDNQAVRELSAELKELTGEGLAFLANDMEHSLEIELPFLQVALAGEFTLLPIMTRSESIQSSEALGLALSKVLDNRNALLVASTDLSHFYPEQTAIHLDQEMLAGIASFQPEALFTTQAEGKGFACGIAAVASVLIAARLLGADQAIILDYSTSADVTGDTSSVVGYGAVALIKST